MPAAFAACVSASRIPNTFRNVPFIPVVSANALWRMFSTPASSTVAGRLLSRSCQYQCQRYSACLPPVNRRLSVSYARCTARPLPEQRRHRVVPGSDARGHQRSPVAPHGWNGMGAGRCRSQRIRSSGTAVSSAARSKFIASRSRPASGRSPPAYAAFPE